MNTFIVLLNETLTTTDLALHFKESNLNMYFQKNLGSNGMIWRTLYERLQLIGVIYGRHIGIVSTLFTGKVLNCIIYNVVIV